MRSLLSILLILALAPLASAQPELGHGELVAGWTVYPDAKKARRFFYPPGELTLAQRDDGAPDFGLLMTRYTGNAASGDQGTWITRSLLSFQVRMEGPTSEQLESVRRALAERGVRRVELLPLPVHRLEAVLAYTPLRPQESSEPTAPRLLPEGHFEAAAEPALRRYWSERPYTLRLADEDAQALMLALEAGQTLLSVGYAFYALGLRPDEPITELSGSPELVEEIRRRLGEDDTDAPEVAGHLVQAGAVDIALDLERWPDLVSRVDLGSQAPPGYGVLSVYCYDFRDQLRQDVFEKQVEIAAEAVGGETVYQRALFSQDQADLYAQTLRFPVAVRLDLPYRFRLRSILLDGSEELGEWQVAESWSRILDVTHRVAADDVISDTPQTGDMP